MFIEVTITAVDGELRQGPRPEWINADMIARFASWPKDPLYTEIVYNGETLLVRGKAENIADAANGRK